MRAGVKRPAKAAIGFSGVAKLEKTRLNHTTSGFSLRMVFSRPHWGRHAAELPATNHVEARQFRLFVALSDSPFASVANP